MTNPPGGILTPSQREFLRGVDLEEKSKSAKSMTRSRIIDRIQTSYIEDVPLIASSLAADSGYNTLDPERIAEIEDRDAFLEGLALQVAVVRELATAADANPKKVIDDGFERELKTAEDRIWRKAREDPEQLTLRELRQLSGDIPDELKEQINDGVAEIDELIAELNEIRPDKTPNRSQTYNKSPLTEEKSKKIAEELPDENHEE